MDAKAILVNKYTGVSEVDVPIPIEIIGRIPPVVGRYTKRNCWLSQCTVGQNDEAVALSGCDNLNVASASLSNS